jgi:hypothetical protein
MPYIDALPVLRDALGDALRRTWQELEELGDEKGSSAVVRDAFVRSLRRALASIYCQPEFAVFGGKPGKNENRLEGVPSGITGWRRWEYLYDVAVVEIDRTCAARANNGHEKRKVQYIKRAVWLVESEFSDNGTEISKDVSKLRIGNSTHKLFLGRASTDTRPDNWLNFIGRLADGCESFYIGLLPTYASGKERESDKWWNHAVEIELYRCLGGRATPQPCGKVPTTPQRS